MSDRQSDRQSGQQFASILFPPELADRALDDTEPTCFSDLNLDQLVVRLSRGRSLQRLQPLFWTQLPSATAVSYRQEAIREIEQPAMAAVMAHFREGFATVLQQLDLRRHTRYAWQQRRCLLDAADLYCAAVTDLEHDLAASRPTSTALQGLRDAVRRYAASAGFVRLREEAQQARDQLGRVTYLLHVRGHRIHVMMPEDEADLGEQVADLFTRFRDMDVTTTPVPYRRPGGFSHIDAAVLEEVAALHPEEFGTLARFDTEHRDFLDPTVLRFARELEFVLAVLELKVDLEARGLPTSFPAVTEDGDATWARGCYDAALATASGRSGRSATSGTSGTSAGEVRTGRPVVTNSFELGPGESIMVVTGPNQGGKTTFARTFGQLHHLAACGCPVPAEDAGIRLVDDVFTLFERQEDAGSDRGKLQDDLVRMRHILHRATRRSVVVLNEMFSSTATDDAADLARRVLDPLLDRGCRGVCVTFLDELAGYRPDVVSMVADVDPEDPGRRLFTLSRRPADGRAYTDSLVAKYQLSPYDIKRRVLR